MLTLLLACVPSEPSKPVDSAANAGRRRPTLGREFHGHPHVPRVKHSYGCKWHVAMRQHAVGPTCPVCLMRSLPALLLALPLTACSEWQFGKGDPADAAGCTESSSDADGDGIADCLTCDVSARPAVDVPSVATCAPGGVEDPFDVVVEAEYWLTGPEGVPVVPNGPILALDIGNTGETDLLGVFHAVNDADDPGGAISVAVTSREQIIYTGTDAIDAVLSTVGFKPNSVWAGATLILGWTWDFTRGQHGVAMFDDAGGTAWISDLVWAGLPPSIGDIEGDGREELAFDDHVIDALQGDTIFVAPNDSIPATIGASTFADLDLDGRQEVVLGSTLFHTDPDPALWTWEELGEASSWWISAPVQLDDDPNGELVLYNGWKLVFYDPDTRTSRSVTTGAEERQDPNGFMVADVDGDGASEVVVATPPAVSVYALDGTLEWQVVLPSHPIDATLSGWDLDADGAVEILAITWEGWFYILDGRTGEAKYSIWNNNGRARGMATVADVDHDGHGEIILPGGVSMRDGQYSSITVLGHAHDQWPPAGPSWSIHDFAVTNVTEEGSVPSVPDPSWLAWNMFHARPADDRGGSNLTPVLDEVCVDVCGAGGTLLVAAQLENTGRRPTVTGTTLNLWSRQDDEDALLGSWSTPDRVQPGKRLEGTVFQVPAESILGAELFLTVDDGNATPECDEVDNRLEVENPCG
jgi:hypothetical protein